MDFKPRDATIGALVALQRPRSAYAYDRRVRPVELQTFRVPAVVVRIKLEQDSDLHLILADPDDRRLRMIAEVPHPDCAIGSGHEEQYRRVRQALRAIPAGAQIELVGVAFFDRAHGQAGAAPNQIELHPILDVKAVKGGAPQ